MKANYFSIPQYASKIMDLPRPLECSEACRRDTLLALLRHKLSEEDENRVLRHLRRCPHCLSVLATILSEARMEIFGNIPDEKREN